MGLADELQKLEGLRSRGTLSDAEFERAKATLLGDESKPEQPLEQHLSEQLAEVRYQNELAQIDREWEIERQQYLITNREGHPQIPTFELGRNITVLGGGFGVVWTIMAISITSGGPNDGPFVIAKIIFPLAGIIGTVSTIRWGRDCQSQAQKYDAAFRAYQVRRSQIAPEQFYKGR